MVKAPAAGLNGKRKEILAFGKLEAFAGALLAVLLSLMCASIARKKTELLELASQLGIKFDESAGDTEARRARLACNTAAIGEDRDVETFCRLRCKQRLADIGSSRFTHKIIFKGPVINRDLAFTGAQKYARGGRLAAPGS